MTKRIEHDDTVVDGIYASILEASSIYDLQRLLCDTLDSPASTMIRIDEAVTPVSWRGFDPGTVGSYHDHYHRTDPWIAAGMTMPLGHGVNVERLVSRDAYLESEFYRDFMRGHGDATQLMGLMFAADDARYSLTFMRVGGQRDFEDAEERRFQHWSPHLRRAFATRDRMARQRRDAIGPDSMRADTDVVHALVSPDLAVQWLSRPTIPAASGIVVRQRPAGPARLEAPVSHVQHALVRAVADASERQPPLSGAVKAGDDFIMVDPCPWTATGRPLALIHIPDRAAIERRAIERATGLYALTTAEAALCRRMMRGDTIEMHAEAMRLSTWTVRTHLRNVFGKTGTGRQAELVALLHRMAR